MGYGIVQKICLYRNHMFTDFNEFRPIDGLSDFRNTSNGTRNEKKKTNKKENRHPFSDGLFSKKKMNKKTKNGIFRTDFCCK